MFDLNEVKLIGGQLVEMGDVHGTTAQHMMQEAEDRLSSVRNLAGNWLDDNFNVAHDHAQLIGKQDEEQNGKVLGLQKASYDSADIAARTAAQARNIIGGGGISL